MRIAQTVAYVSAATFVIWGSSAPSAQADLKDRLASAVETVEKHCGNDVNAFCGKVTRGEGRDLLCMQAHEDQLSRSCQFALIACRGDWRMRCIAWRRPPMPAGPTSKPNAARSSASASASRKNDRPCRRRAKVRSRAYRRSCTAHSDCAAGRYKALITKTSVTSPTSIAEPMGRFESVKIEIGRFLGLGSKVVTISGDKLKELGERSGSAFRAINFWLAAGCEIDSGTRNDRAPAQAFVAITDGDHDGPT